MNKILYVGNRSQTIHSLLFNFLDPGSGSACPIRILIRIQGRQISADPCASGSTTLLTLYIPYCTWPPLIYHTFFVRLMHRCAVRKGLFNICWLFTVCSYSELHHICKTFPVKTKSHRHPLANQ
jgi:hypothetical protein